MYYWQDTTNSAMEGYNNSNYLSANWTMMNSTENNGHEVQLTNRLWVKHIGLAIISIFSVIGNGLLIYTIARNRHLHTVTNVFIISLATADFMFGFPTVPIHIIAEGATGETFGLSLANLCLISMSLTTFQILTSVFSLFAVTLERYICILHPLKHRKWTRRRFVAGIISTLWIYCAVFGMMPLMGWNALRHYNPWDSTHNHTDIPVPRCHFVIANTGQYTGCIVFLNLMPVYVSMPYLYWRMFWAVRQFIIRKVSQNTTRLSVGRHHVNDSCTRHTKQAIIRRTSRRSLRLLVVLTIYSIFSWTPNVIWFIVATKGFTQTHMTQELFQNIPIPMEYYEITASIGFASSAVNPYIYGLGNVRIRRAFLNMFRNGRFCGFRWRTRDDEHNAEHLSMSSHTINGINIIRTSSLRQRRRKYLHNTNIMNTGSAIRTPV